MNQIVFSSTVFLAGVLSFFSPCVFPLLPVYIGVLLGSDQEKSIQIFGKKIRWHGIVKTLCFIAGISVIFLLIGFGASRRSFAHTWCILPIMQKWDVKWD